MTCELPQPNKALHLTAIPLRSIAAGDLCRKHLKRKRVRIENFLHSLGLNFWQYEGMSQETKPYPSLVKTDGYGQATDEPAAYVTYHKTTYTCRICGRKKEKVEEEIAYC